MNEKSRKILEDAGWYEGRKIDIKEIIKIYEASGKEVFSKAKEFLEEFAGLEIGSNNYIDHSFNVKKLFKDSYSSSSRLAPELEITLEQKVLLVGICSSFDIYIYISEDGKIYDDYGLIGKDMYSFWDYALRTISFLERMKGLTTWAELGLDQKLYDAEQQLLAEDPITPEQKELLRQFNPTLVD